MNELRHISDVCKELSVTSRTIRYYEQLGLIRSVRADKTAPRRLDSENIERIRKILFLRKLGLTLEEIASVLNRDTDTADLIRSKAAEFRAEINALHERMTLLAEVLETAENGGNIYAVQTTKPQPDTEVFRMAAECAKAIAEGHYDQITAHVLPKFQTLLAPSLEAVWPDFIKPCGAFIELGEQYAEKNVVKTKLIYEQIDVIMKTGIIGGKISGIFMDYSKKEEENQNV